MENLKKVKGFSKCERKDKVNAVKSNGISVDQTSKEKTLSTL